jgi:hypothetical protein
LRLAGARLVVGPTVGQEGAPAEAELRPGGQRLGASRGDLAPSGRRAALRHRPERIEAEIEIEIGEGMATPLRQRRDERRGGESFAAGLDAQLDQVELHIAQGPIEFLDGARAETEAARARRLREDKRERIGAAFEIGESKAVGGLRIGMVDALGDAPGSRGRAPQRLRS